MGAVVLNTGKKLKLIETDDIVKVPFLQGQYIIVDSGTIYYDPTFGTDINSRVCLTPKKEIDIYERVDNASDGSYLALQTNPINGDMVIIRDLLANTDVYKYTVYVYNDNPDDNNSNGWCLLNEAYDALDVYFSDNIVSPTDETTVLLETAGKNLKDAFRALVVKAFDNSKIQEVIDNLPIKSLAGTEVEIEPGVFTTALEGATVVSDIRDITYDETSSPPLQSGSIATGKWATVIGRCGEARGKYAISLGSRNKAYGDYAFAVGNGSVVGELLEDGTYSGNSAVAIGRGAIANGATAISLGHNSRALGDYSISLGSNTETLGQNSVAIGISTDASGLAAFALGDTTEAVGDYSFAFGHKSRTLNSYSIAGGFGAVAKGAHSLALGNNAYSEMDNSIAIGSITDALGDHSVAIGYGSQSTGIGSIAIGDVNVATADYAISLGYGSGANAPGSIAIGRMAASNGEHAVSLGNGNVASGKHSLASGINSKSIGDYSVALGQATEALGKASFTVGYGNHSNSSYAITMGINNTVSGDAGLAVGYNHVASGNYTTALGHSNKPSGYTAMAVNYQTTASGSCSFASGQGTIAAGSQQTVHGKFNIEDNTNVYAYILGNGTSTNARSNAFTIDWLGNAVLSGTLKVNGGTDEIALKSDLENLTPGNNNINTNKVILTSSNGSKFILSVEDDGSLVTEDYDGTSEGTELTTLTLVSANGTSYTLGIQDDGSLTTTIV